MHAEGGRDIGRQWLAPADGGASQCTHDRFFNRLVKRAIDARCVRHPLSTLRSSRQQAGHRRLASIGLHNPIIIQRGFRPMRERDGLLICCAHPE